MNTTDLERKVEMSYELSWRIPGKVLSLSLSGTYTLEAAEEVNRLINDRLNASQSPLMLLINALEMDRPYHFERIRALQTYMDHENLKNIYIVAVDNVVKLSLLVIFNLGRARLQLCDNVEKANRLIMHH